MAGQQWAQSEYGGVWSNQELSDTVAMQAQPIMRYRQFCETDESYGSNKGDTLLFDKVLNVDTEGGPLDENMPFPRTGFKTIQGQCVATEYGNSIPFSEKLERMAKLDSQSMYVQAITNDVGKALNRAPATQFRSARIKMTPVGTDGDPRCVFQAQATSTIACTATATRQVQVEDVLVAQEALKSGIYTNTTNGTVIATGSPVPPFDDDGNYACLCSVGFASAIRRDSDFINASLYGDPERLFAGEIGRFQGIRFIEDNHILRSSMDGFRGEALFFGKGAVKQIVCLMEEIRKGVPLDGGRDRSWYWYAILGFKLIWEFNATTEPDNRIIHFTSSGITS